MGRGRRVRRGGGKSRQTWRVKKEGRKDGTSEAEWARKSARGEWRRDMARRSGKWINEVEGDGNK